MSSPVELPDDVLFNIIKLLRPPDIFSVRKVSYNHPFDCIWANAVQTCKRLQAITMDRHVWITAYKYSENDFSPVVDLASQTVGNMERVLIRSYRLNNLWVNPSAKPVCKKVWSIDSSAYGGLGHEMEFVEIYQGRYLVLRHEKVILVFDLQTKHEIFRYNAPMNKLFDFLWLDAGRNKIVDDNPSDFFDRPSDHHFELYRLSCHTEETPLMPTHRGCFVCDDVDRVSLLSSDITLDDRSELTGRIWIFMHLTGGPQQQQLQCITLSADGCLTFSEVSHPDSLHELRLTVHSAGKSRGTAWERSEGKSGGKPRWLLCQVSIDSGEPLICTGAQLDVDKIGMHSVEVSQGYLVTRELGGEINIVDLV